MWGERKMALTNNKIKKIAIVCILITMLFGCATQNTGTSDNANISNDANSNQSSSEPTNTTDNSSEQPGVQTNSEGEQSSNKPDNSTQNNIVDEMAKEKLRSFSMLYYLAITAEDIRSSKDNRLVLDDIYTSLLNEINPGAVDDITQEHLQNLKDIIAKYLNIAVKRERLQYIYNQQKAAAIRSAVPNPLTILSMTNSLDWKKLAINTIYTIVDSYVSYKNAEDAANMEFIMSGWDLDDEETEAIRKNRDRAQNYMIDIAQEYEYSIDEGKLTLSEKDILNFSEICKIDNVQQKIRRLESEVKSYKLLGNYWLELADCYFETSQYQKCLDCIDSYRKLSIEIFTKDHSFVRLLPKAIVSAQEVYKNDTKKYVSVIDGFAQTIMDNTEVKEWSIRYFAAQVYMDLYTKTNDPNYLEKSYNIAYDNVAVLIDEQKKINSTYMADVKEETISEPNYKYMDEDQKKEAEKEYKAEKKRLKKYNDSLKEARKTELPSLYEPLIVNCDLLFALANKLNISDKEKSEIEAILQTKTRGVFVNEPINNYFSFTNQKSDTSIEIKKDKILIPVTLLADCSHLTATIKSGSELLDIDDFVISNVDRKEKNNIDSFIATYTSKEVKKHKWNQGDMFSIEITNDGIGDPLVLKYKLVEYKENFIGSDTMIFEQQ